MRQIRSIFFEGIDKVGKSSLLSTFNEITNYEYLCFDRGPVSKIAYDIIHKRNPHCDGKINFHAYSHLLTDSLTIYVTCDPDIIAKRMSILNHEDIPINSHTKVFDRVIQRLSEYLMLGVLHIDTSEDDETQSAYTLQVLINQIERGVIHA